MKREIKRLILVLTLLSALGVASPAHLLAQTFNVLHHFTATSFSTNADGANPSCQLVIEGNTLYGTATYGGASSNGTLFAINTDGTGFRHLHQFTATPSSANTDGANPRSGLILSNDILYGTTFAGGIAYGTVFAVHTDGTGFTNFHMFNFTGWAGGGEPIGRLLLSGYTLYGTSTLGYGTLFKIKIDGTGFQNFYDATPVDGTAPYAGLILSSNTLYGTTEHGGTSDVGTVFGILPDGSGFTNLHSFLGNSMGDRDGSYPLSDLVVSDNILYGVTQAGGDNNSGTVFKIGTDGANFLNLHSFAFHYNGPEETNSGGAYPVGGLLLSGNTLYGTASVGGNFGFGTVFCIQRDGTDFKTLHNFTRTDGAYPLAGLNLSGNALYGTTHSGGAWGNGTVFSLTFRPQLSIIPYGTYVIVTWPTNVAGFNYSGYSLQSATNLDGSSTTWTTISQRPIVIGGQNLIVHPASGTQRFYRLLE